MSKIAIEIIGYVDLPGTISVIKKVTGKGIAEIKHCIEVQLPVWEAILFYNNHNEVATGLADIVKKLPAIGTQLAMYELEESDDATNLTRYQDCIITGEMLMNMLAMHNDEIDRQQDYNQ
ncbi:hypothetical protein [Filimonas lacunae]|nr:hypothetical protein [Filimonas lacunae]